MVHMHIDHDYIKRVSVIHPPFQQTVILNSENVDAKLTFLPYYESIHSARKKRVYSKTCIKRPLKIRQIKDPNDKW